jgi:two-component system, chemotaxis family, sensor kinase CheA
MEKRSPLPELPRRRFLPLGLKLSLAVVLVLVIASTWATLTLVKRARAELFEAKRAGASMVVRLFAASVAAPLDFGDGEALETKVGEMRSNEHVVYAAIWRPGVGVPEAEFQRGSQARALPDGPASRFFPEALELTERVLDPTGVHLGSVVVRFTLLPEIARYEDTRQRIQLFSALLTLMVAGVLLAIARWQIVSPLQRLSSAARDLEHGKAVRVPIRSADEIGALFAVFNQMSQAIADREGSLRDLNGRLQGLLDHMRQGILVFGPQGKLEDVRSREAQELFQLDENTSKTLPELLYRGRPESVEAQALEAWLDAAFATPAADWEEIRALAPTEAVLNPGTDSERNLLLEFRLLSSAPTVDRIMLLLTDETEKRHLEEVVQRKDREYRQQMAALRRFVSGGEALTSMLRRGAERITQCRTLLAGASEELGLELIDALFQHAHSMKSEARCFELLLLESAAAALEDVLDIARRRALNGERLPRAELADKFSLRLEEMASQIREAESMLIDASPIGEEVLHQVSVSQKDLEELETLVGSRSDALGSVARRLVSRPFGESVFAMAEAAPRWANAHGKRARVEIEGKRVRVPGEVARVLPGVLSHLIRNAVAHGIESPDQRTAAGKPEVGVIQVSCVNELGQPRIEISDDGSGIDQQALARQRSELGLSELSGEDLLFVPGVTTAARVDELAGRGMGLASVRSDLSEVGYCARIRSTPGRGTTVVLQSLQEASA